MTSMRQLSSAVCEHSIGDTVVKEVAFLEDQVCSFSSVLVWDRLGVYADHVCRKMNQRREWNYSSPPKGTSLWPLSSATPHAYPLGGFGWYHTYFIDEYGCRLFFGTVYKRVQVVSA